jgi:hypothetical protein
MGIRSAHPKAEMMEHQWVVALVGDSVEQKVYWRVALLVSKSVEPLVVLEVEWMVEQMVAWMVVL